MIFLDKGKSCDEIREMFDWGEQTATLEEEVQVSFGICICICICNVIVFELVPIQNEEVFLLRDTFVDTWFNGNRVQLPKHAMLEI